jgi:hypothetical protein
MNKKNPRRNVAHAFLRKAILARAATHVSRIDSPLCGTGGDDSADVT